ncbi:Acetokinase family-domain-containing protein [Gymnopilus junonius]|uniref:Probable acetate kinase n=1 Tax=Gymnopilus junonius TaxID=109634 RepID=A0A9P5TSY1_GYMJU|nr:Acetokinase family-domain-containing protein [Gymnopilus junonius]
MTSLERNLILSVNAGSSSLKISLFSTAKRLGFTEPVALVFTSSISSISGPPAKFSFRLATGEQRFKDKPVDSIKDHSTAFAHFLDYLENHCSIPKSRIVYVCHRVVHGGDYAERVEMDPEAYHHLERLSDLAPLHNGAALSVIKACIDAMSEARSVAYFDTSFHRSIPSHISSYAIDQKIATERGLRKYGFHGLSYAFILRSVSRFLERPPESLNLILLHLGSGASVCAIKAGKSYDTSMELTPLSGLPGATRSGSIDPSLIFHYTNKAGRITHDPSMATNVGVTMAEDILNRKSGWKAMTGTTDFGTVTSKADLSAPASTDEDLEILRKFNPHRLAFDLFTDRIIQFIGSYYLKLGSEVDALVFSGGIGENGAELRSVIGKKMECLGFCKVDEERNAKARKEDAVVIDISVGSDEDEERKKRVLVCKTDEQVCFICSVLLLR